MRFFPVNEVAEAILPRARPSVEFAILFSQSRAHPTKEWRPDVNAAATARHSAIRDRKFSRRPPSIRCGIRAPEICSPLGKGTTPAHRSEGDKPGLGAFARDSWNLRSGIYTPISGEIKAPHLFLPPRSGRVVAQRPGGGGLAKPPHLFLPSSRGGAAEPGTQTADTGAVQPESNAWVPALRSAAAGMTAC